MTESPNSPKGNTAETLATRLHELVASCRDLLKAQKIGELNARIEEFTPIMQEINSLTPQQLSPYADILRNAAEEYHTLQLAAAVQKNDISREMCKTRSAGKVALVYGQSTRSQS